MARSSDEDSRREKAPSRRRDDGRKALLVYLPTNLIKDLKKAGLDDDRNVYEIVEEASQEWLSRRAQNTSVK
jgi:hypothetical protein